MGFRGYLNLSIAYVGTGIGIHGDLPMVAVGSADFQISYSLKEPDGSIRESADGEILESVFP